MEQADTPPRDADGYRQRQEKQGHMVIQHITRGMESHQLGVS